MGPTSASTWRRVGGRRPPGRRVPVAVVGVLLGFVTLVTPPVAATAEADEAAFEVLPETLDVLPDTYDHTQGKVTPLILWPEGRRAYQLATSTPGGLADIVVPIDLDTLEPITEVVDGEERRVDSGPLEPTAVENGERYRLQPEQIALDHERGVMFFPHRSESATCKGTSPLIKDECLGGIHVLDLVDDALDGPAGLARNPIPFFWAGRDWAIQSPVLWAMSHTASLGGERGKLHLLIGEVAHWTGPTDSLVFVPRDVRSPHYVVQIDVATGATDWVEPAPGCTSFRGRGMGDGPTEAVQMAYTIFAGGSAEQPYVYVGCYGPSSVGSVGRLQLDPDDPSRPPLGGEAFPGPGSVSSIQSDPASERLWFKSLSGGDETWWVFDGGVSTYLGVVGIGEEVGETGGSSRTGAVDPATGRLYVMEGWDPRDNFTTAGGLYVSDGRRVPIPQATIHRDLPMQDLQHLTERSDGKVDYTRDEDGNLTERHHRELLNPMVVDPGDGDRPRRLFFRPGQTTNSERWYVIADHRPVSDTVIDTGDIVTGVIDDPPATDDVELVEGLTRQTFTGTARGYGLRTILLGGTDAVWLPGSQSHWWYGSGVQGNFLLPDTHPCGPRNHEFGFGLTGSLDGTSVVDPGGTTGTASPVVVDEQTRRDLAEPHDRCGGAAVEQAEDVATEGSDVGAIVREQLEDNGIDGSWLPSNGGEDEVIPGELPADPGTAVDHEEARCAAPEFDEDGSRQPSSTGTSGDDGLVGPVHAAEVHCEDDLAMTGWSRSRFASAGPVSVAEAFSEYDVARDPDTGGLYASALAYARGVSIVHEVTGPTGDVMGTSTVTIDKVETTAEAWATGRPSHEDAVGCDVEDRTRGAGTCIRTTIVGARVVDGVTGEVFECEQCDREEQNQLMLTAMRRALGNNWTVQIREPDPLLARGASNGALAGVQKRGIDEFADIVMKGDQLKTLPGLEMVRYNDNIEGRGRQVYLFAGVELSAKFGRQCLGVVDGQDCVAPPVPLAEVQVNLTNGLDGSPLRGGRFELAQTSAVSGATPLDSPVSCTTNGAGRCELVALPAGSYTLTQTDAPGDYAPAEPLSLDLSPGSVFDVSVTNVREVGSLVAGLTDLDGVPLAGGMFELHADVDGDGTVGLDDPQVDVCSTGADGTCTMADLPLGAYVLSQAAAPDGYAAVDDQVPFVLDVPGQTATIGYTNAPEGSGASGSGSLSSVTELPPTQPVAVERPPGAEGPQVADPQASSALPRAPFPQQLAETWQLLRRNPVQAAAFGLLLALSAAAVAGPMRRRLLLLTAG